MRSLITLLLIGASHCIGQIVVDSPSPSAGTLSVPFIIVIAVAVVAVCCCCALLASLVYFSKPIYRLYKKKVSKYETIV